jgi:hypothetical protein
MRCPDCGKFVSHELGEVEVEESSVNDDMVTGTVRLHLDCMDCGNELAETTLEFEAAIEHECPKAEEGTPTFDTNTDEAAEGGDYFQDKNAKGKPIKPRYQKHFYTADITGTVVCDLCEESIDWEAHVEEAASAFDSLT